MGKSLIVHCPTIEEYTAVETRAFKEGKRWHSNSKTIHLPELWESYRSKTCIHIEKHSLSFSSHSFFNGRGDKIITASEYLADNKKLKRLSDTSFTRKGQKTGSMKGSGHICYVCNKAITGYAVYICGGTYRHEKCCPGSAKWLLSARARVSELTEFFEREGK